MNDSTAPSGVLRVAFNTLGCRLNQYDTELMKAGLSAGASCEIVPWSEPADVYVLNSCTVTGKADQKCRQMARQVKRRHPDAKVVVTGCYAQTQPEALAAIPELDGVFGNLDKDRIAEWLPRVLEGTRTLVEVTDFPRRLSFGAGEISDFSGRSRAFVKIQDGCDLRCAYCLIWRARGPSRSRPVDEVVHQIAALADAGFPEVVLAGINLGAYGRDQGRRDGLLSLLRDLLAGFPDLRFRLSSIHPNEVTPGLLSLFGEFPNLRRYMHVSLQSGDDEVLRRMKRPYRSSHARAAVAAIGELGADFGIGADVIVGFPGESEAEFANTERLLAELPFSYLHVFRYSPRPDTPAAGMTPVQPEIVTARAARLREFSRARRRVFETGLIGTLREAVVETDIPEPGWVHATTDNYAVVLVPAGRAPGSRVLLRPAGFRGEHLYAESVEIQSDGAGKTMNEESDER